MCLAIALMKRLASCVSVICLNSIRWQIAYIYYACQAPAGEFLLLNWHTAKQSNDRTMKSFNFF